MYRYKLDHIKNNQTNFTKPFPYLYKVKYQIPFMSALERIFLVSQGYVRHMILCLSAPVFLIDFSCLRSHLRWHFATSAVIRPFQQRTLVIRVPLVPGMSKLPSHVLFRLEVGGTLLSLPLSHAVTWAGKERKK